MPDDDPLPDAIGRPATAALVGAGYPTLSSVAGVPAATLLALHGVGPKAIRLLQEALEETGRSPGA